MEEEKIPQESRMQPRERWLFLAALAAMLVVIGTGVALTVYVTGKKKQAGPVAPGFVLRDQQGRLTSLAQFRGKVVVLAFIDPVCRQLCPLTTQGMVEALKILGPSAASRVQLLGIDVNPQKTTVTDVAAYTRAHELQGRWRFLTGSPAQLKKIWRNYHVYVTTANGGVEHEAVVYVIDRNGDERAVYSTPMSYEAIVDQAQTLAERIAPLLPGHPSVSPSRPPSSPKPKPLSASATVRLASLGLERQPVLLGGAHPHLMLFFAGWLGKNSALKKKLATLDRYASLAHRRGWPSPVAVDELTTEPSPAEARRVLEPLASALRTPIVEDATGRLADRYRVQDLPWFVLSSPSGKVLWHHDGWLSAAVLSRDVHAALAAH